jgi:hypothetical protein
LDGHDLRNALVSGSYWSSLFPTIDDAMEPHTAEERLAEDAVPLSWSGSGAARRL